MLIFSGTEHLVVLEDKLSTTTVVLPRSEGKLNGKCLYGIWKPKHTVDTVKSNSNWKPKKCYSVNLMVIRSLRSMEVLAITCEKLIKFNLN